MTTVVRLEAHSSAAPLMMREGTPVMGEAHSGLLVCRLRGHDIVLELSTP